MLDIGNPPGRVAMVATFIHKNDRQSEVTESEAIQDLWRNEESQINHNITA
jgi:hypothetical protein